ncbi:MAG: hypothetical protein ACUVXJ_19995, partial [Phycisphaerae bacterium]
MARRSMLMFGEGMLAQGLMAAAICLIALAGFTQHLPAESGGATASRSASRPAGGQRLEVVPDPKQVGGEADS